MRRAAAGSAVPDDGRQRWIAHANEFLKACEEDAPDGHKGALSASKVCRGLAGQGMR